MGQYHYVVNLDRHEFINPHALGDGLKLWEQGASRHGTLAALHMLLAVSNGRGGGDYDDTQLGDDRVIGRWGGDRIAIVGDYAEPTDLAHEHDAATIYQRCILAEDLDDPDYKAFDGPGEQFRDISALVAPYLEREFEFQFVGDGWRSRRYADGTTAKPPAAIDIVVGPTGPETNVRLNRGGGDDGSD